MGISLENRDFTSDPTFITGQRGIVAEGLVEKVAKKAQEDFVAKKSLEEIGFFSTKRAVSKVIPFWLIHGDSRSMGV